MSRILLADDSPHAQRMGERILREEGFEVVTVTDGNTALIRLADVDPDVVFADISLPSKSGYDICRELKALPRHKHVRVILTAGLLEPFDEELAKEVRCDGVLKKPFESSVVLETVRPLVEAAGRDRAAEPESFAALSSPDGALQITPEVVSSPETAAPEPQTAVALKEHVPYEPVAPAMAVKVVSDDEVLPEPPLIDAERVRAAVTLALDAAMPAMIDKITEKVLVALGH